MDICERLFSMQDIKYKEFQSKLCPTVDSESIIGVRTPKLKALAKEIVNSGEWECFTDRLPHKYFEENQLHAFILSQIKDYDILIDKLERFLPFIDNWATCDQLRPKIFSRNTDILINDVKRWLSPDDTYTKRFGIGMLMCHYLDKNFREEYLLWVSQIKSDEYYINMMTAWYFATALAKQYSAAVRYIESRSLDTWVHNKTIQKACESFRVSDEHKEYLKKLKICIGKNG